MTAIQLAATPAQHEATASQMTAPDIERSRHMINKAWRVINSCQRTPAGAWCAGLS